MNIRKIKLTLTVGLLNSDGQHNALGLVRELMGGFQEAGRFLGLTRLQNNRLNATHFRETYAMRYENCTLNVDLVSNAETQRQYVQGFRIY